MVKRYTDSDKLKALALMKTESSLLQIAEKLDIGYATLLRWRTEMIKAEENAEIEKLVEVTPAVVHRIANEVKQELKDLNIPKSFDPGFENLEEAQEGELLDRPAPPPSANEIIEATVGELVDGIDGYQRLSTKLQDVANNIACRIDAMAAVAAGPSELAILVESLATLQTSFFNKNVTNLNILNAPSSTSNTFNGFKNRS